MSTSFLRGSPARRWIRQGACVFSSVAVLMLSAGCQGPRVMRDVFVKYSDAYADSSNQQMLLNLARCANGHPSYFLQMGSINSVFQFSSSLAGNVARTDSPGGLRTIARGASLTLTANEQPSFNMTPLSGSSFATAIFNPIDPKIFFALFDQGIPADKLLRVMVSSVSLSMTVSNATSVTKSVRTFVNVLDSERPASYQNFLIMAGLARELQKHQYLTSSSNRNSFVLSQNAGDLLADLVKQPGFRFLPEEHGIVTFKSGGKGDPSPASAPGTDIDLDDVSMTLRTFEGILTALGTESQIFDAIVAQMGTNWLDQVPPMERRPILRISHHEKAKLTPSVVEVHYRGQKYNIADEMAASHSSPERLAATLNTANERWNRDVFKLLNLLYVQIALDPSKLPVQQLIQVH